MANEMLVTKTGGWAEDSPSLSLAFKSGGESSARGTALDAKRAWPTAATGSCHGEDSVAQETSGATARRVEVGWNRARDSSIYRSAS